MFTAVYSVPQYDEGTDAKIYCYIPGNSPEIAPNRKRKTVVLCPGGGYVMTSDREAEPVALSLCAKDYNVLVLRYSVDPHRFPTALCELAYTVALAREHAEEWNVDTAHIVVMGFSAGAHLACSLGTLWPEKFLSEAMGLPRECFQPNGMILCYPVISSGAHAHQGSFHALLGDRYEAEHERFSLDTRVSAQTPPAFVWHTWDDDCVPVENSLLFAAAMKRADRPMELHIYEHGVHGMSLCSDITGGGDPILNNPACAGWFELAAAWLDRL